MMELYTYIIYVCVCVNIYTYIHVYTTSGVGVYHLMDTDFMVCNGVDATSS